MRLLRSSLSSRIVSSGTIIMKRYDMLPKSALRSDEAASTLYRKKKTAPSSQKMPVKT